MSPFNESLGSRSMRSATSIFARFGLGFLIRITKSTTLTAEARPPKERSSETVSLISNDSEIKLGYGVIYT